MHFIFFALLAYLCATTPLLGDGWLAAAVHYLGLGAVLAVFPASAAVMGITGNLGAASESEVVRHGHRACSRRATSRCSACACCSRSPSA